MKRSLYYRPQLNVLEDRVTPVAPVRTPPPPLYTEPIPLEDVCPFPAEITYLTNKEVIKKFYDREGNLLRTLRTGALKVQVTNPDTGKSLVLNISGPGVTYPGGTPDDTSDDTSINRGAWLYYFTSDNTQGQGTGLILIHGRIESSETSFTVLSGHVEDNLAQRAWQTP